MAFLIKRDCRGDKAAQAATAGSEGRYVEFD